MIHFNEILKDCIKKWRAEGIPMAPPVAESEIRRVWDHFGMPVSEDVLQLYSTLGGFRSGVCDEDFLWFFWPFDEVFENNTRYPSPGIQFCDHSIQVVNWEIRYENPKVSSVWRVPEDLEGSSKAADDLESYFRLYLDDSYQLLVIQRP